MKRKTANMEAATEALREAINQAVLAGNSLDIVWTVINDQLFGIEVLGGGDVNEMKRKHAEIQAQIEEEQS